MKKIALVFVVCLVGWSVSVADPPPAGFGVSFGVFYSSLSPYGDWISVGTDLYGWRPHHMATDWRPYSYGRWIWTDDGWYWASDEPWGWAAYHYGRWYYDDYYGWVWVPGYDWAPAWVEWRYGGDYVGWAPLSPYAVFSVSFGIHYRTHWATPNYWWSFVDCGHIAVHDMHRYVYRNDGNVRYIGRTRNVGSVRYEGGRVVSRGPDRGEVERRGNVRIDRADIVDVTDHQGERVVRGGDNRERIESYRPRISASDSRTGVERPPALRQSDRPATLDPRGLDVRSHAEDLEHGRNIRRSQQYQQQRNLEMQQNQSRADDPRSPFEGSQRLNRSGDRVPAPRTSAVEQAPHLQQRDQLRSREPERVIRRPEYRGVPSTRIAPQVQAEPRRSEEGGGQRSSQGRGGESGGSRGGEHRR